LRRTVGLSVTPHLNPLLTVLESAIDNDSLETALVYPIDLRGDDDQPFKSPVTNIELDPDENGTRPTIG
jgi:hypothetical protein